jgi:hypothetical protein
VPSIAVLIVAPVDDLHALAVMQALKRRQISAKWVAFDALNQGVRLTLAIDHVHDAQLRTVGGEVITLADVGTVWWRRPRRPADQPEVDEKTKTFIQGEWDHFIDGLEAYSAVRWVNQPTAHRLAARKPGQLIAAQAEGLRVPRTRITNDPEVVRHFAALGFPLIHKRIGISPEPLAGTKPLLGSDFDRLELLCNCPAIFQERIDARFDIRVTVIGPDLHAAEIDSQAGASPLDWRFDHTVAFRPHALDPTVAAQLAATVRRLGLLYAAIDLRLTPQGEYVFLEVNPGGQFLFVEFLAQLPLSEHMATFLARDPAAESDAKRTVNSRQGGQQSDDAGQLVRTG